MAVETGVEVRVQVPGRVRNRKIAREVAALTAAKKNSMVKRSPRDIQRMMRRGNAVVLVAEKEGKSEVVGFGGITHEFRRGFLRKVEAAEFGALVTADGYEGNGFGRRITETVAERYVSDPVKQLVRHNEFVLFAMAGFNNEGSNRLFQRLGGKLMSSDSLPEAALAEGRDYYIYNITHLGTKATNL